jgi:hypothetical protein
VVLLIRFAISETRFSRALAQGFDPGPDLASVDSLPSFLRIASTSVTRRDDVIQDIDSGAVGDPALRRLLAERRRRLREFAIGGPVCLFLTIPWSYAANAILAGAGGSPNGAADLIVVAILAYIVVGTVMGLQIVRALRARQLHLAAATTIGLVVIGATLVYFLARM